MKDRGRIWMNCMKCGRETGETQIFCDECLADMAKYPVKPGTVVQLPARLKDVPVKKSGRRPQIPLEEQIKVLKKRVFVLGVMFVLTFSLLVAATGFLIWRMGEEDVKILPGQNYTAEETTVPTPR